MRKINLIVIHCSATGPNSDIGAEDIRRWHKARGWSDIGYHWVIRRDGTIEPGREELRSGAHAKGYNQRSIGVCLVGGVDENQEPANNFTPAQWEALDNKIVDLMGEYVNASICGHRDLPGVAKSCPCFEVEQWLDSKGWEDWFYEPL